MKRFLLTALAFYFLNILLPAQTITGKIVDQNAGGVSNLMLKLYMSATVYTTTSTADGSFSFTNITEVKAEQLPTGYSVSDNYPNPFNPRTRIGFTLPEKGSVKVTIFNQLGQQVREEAERNFSAGNSYIDLELNGLANGFYIAHLAIDGKYNITRKLMLLYGSQHLKTASGIYTVPQINKTTSPSG